MENDFNMEDFYAPIWTWKNVAGTAVCVVIFLGLIFAFITAS